MSIRTLRQMLCGSHIKIWNDCKSHEKNEAKNIRPLVFSFLSINLAFFHLVCKISNFNMWTTKYLAQASCTELILSSFNAQHEILILNESFLLTNCEVSHDIEYVEFQGCNFVMYILRINYIIITIINWNYIGWLS